jgi:hypothetical protein
MYRISVHVCEAAECPDKLSNFATMVYKKEDITASMET